MSPSLLSIAQWAALTLAWAVTAQAPFKIMPLGASITFGYLSSDGNGYRQDLLTQLTDYGYSIDYVGSLQGGTMADNDVEGFVGLRIEQVQSHAETDVPIYLPNMYTINLGTNDCAQNFDIDNAGSRMNDLLSYLWSTTPDAVVILSTLLINLDADTESRVENVNAQFTDLYNTLAGQGRKIVLADMHGSDGPQPGDMADDTHPNDVGYQKMANIWYREILDAQARGFF